MVPYYVHVRFSPGSFQGHKRTVTANCKSASGQMGVFLEYVFPLDERIGVNQAYRQFYKT